MILGWRRLAGVVLVLASGFAVVVATAAAQGTPPASAVNTRLEDALRALQSGGLRVVFSSKLVTRDMRVLAEPRAAAARDRLAELLKPHGLEARSGPGGVLEVVRSKPRRAVPVRPAGEASPAATAPGPAPDDVRLAEVVYSERVDVNAGRSPDGVTGVPASRALDRLALRSMAGTAIDDPMRLVQSLPGVAATDDFRSEYSVRFSPYRHASLVVDGVTAPWLQHAAVDRVEAGSMTMLHAEVMDAATLKVGGYARRDAGQLGPQLDVALREGSRERLKFRGTAGSAYATWIGEGPLGSSRQGSWMIGARKSYREWPLGRQDYESPVFGIADVHSKFVYDVGPRHHLSVSTVAGVSNVERENSRPAALLDGTNGVALVAGTWRSLVGRRTVVSQQVSFLTHEFTSGSGDHPVAHGGTNRAVAYRADLAQAAFGGVLDTGVQTRAVSATRLAESGEPSVSGPRAVPFAAEWWERSAHASIRWGRGRASVAPGLRVAHSTLSGEPLLDRWVQAEARVGSGWLLHGSAAVVHQMPEADHERGRSVAERLRPERAMTLDAGVGQQLSSSVRWDATFFVRHERDVIRGADVPPGIWFGGLDPGAWGYQNALSGRARGVELLVARQSDTGIAGWIGYAYGTATHVDTLRGERYRAEFDQRHALNALASAPLPAGGRLSVTFRTGSNFPVPGYLTVRDGRVFAGGARNQLSLPTYARLDLHAERTVGRLGGPLTLFVDAINLTNRVNVGLGDAVLDRETGEVSRATGRLYPRLVTAGIRVAF